MNEHTNDNQDKPRELKAEESCDEEQNPEDRSNDQSSPEYSENKQLKKLIFLLINFVITAQSLPQYFDNRLDKQWF